jgi:hypothetical protein
MQSENFDKKIKDSLSQRPPGKDKPAWDKMEPLLDKHLPVEKKDRRRVFFILFLFLLLGGGGFLIWKNGNGDKNNITAIESQNNNPDPTATGSTKDNKSATNNTSDVTTNADKENFPEKISGKAKNKTDSHFITIVPQNSLPQILPGKEMTINANKVKKDKEKKIDIPASEKTDQSKKINSIDQSEKQLVIEDVSKKEPNTVSADKNESVKTETQKSIPENKTEEQKPETKESQPLTTKKSDPQKQKSQRSFLDNLFFSASAGPDFSSVGFHSPGKIELAYGAGLGYKISDKFSIRTGFYSARKVYTADPKDYDPPYNVAQYYPNLKQVDANCKVYEIPVMIDYTISKNKKGSWFVSGGVSSLIMKEEKYSYYFKPNYSPTYVTYTRTIKDQNKHYFSQLNISGGYTRNINNNISLRAEPYVKFALNGIGFGKVNLNSSGVLFSAIIKPFAKK